MTTPKIRVRRAVESGQLADATDIRDVLDELDKLQAKARRRPKVYVDQNDWWIGYYRGDHYHYVCPLPTVVIRWPR